MVRVTESPLKAFDVTKLESGKFQIEMSFEKWEDFLDMVRNIEKHCVILDYTEVEEGPGRFKMIYKLLCGSDLFYETIFEDREKNEYSIILRRVT